MDDNDSLQLSLSWDVGTDQCDTNVAQSMPKTVDLGFTIQFMKYRQWKRWYHGHKKPPFPRMNAILIFSVANFISVSAFPYFFALGVTVASMIMTPVLLLTVSPWIASNAVFRIARGSGWIVIVAVGLQIIYEAWMNEPATRATRTVSGYLGEMGASATMLRIVVPWLFLNVSVFLSIAFHLLWRTLVPALQSYRYFRVRSILKSWSMDEGSAVVVQVPDPVRAKSPKSIGQIPDTGDWLVLPSSGVLATAYKKEEVVAYLGEVNDLGRPHGFGMWVDDGNRGERLVGWWRNGQPVGPFTSKIDQVGSTTYCSSFGFVVLPSYSHPEKAIFGIANGEAFRSGAWYSGYPLVHIRYQGSENNKPLSVSLESESPAIGERGNRMYKKVYICDFAIRNGLRECSGIKFGDIHGVSCECRISHFKESLKWMSGGLRISRPACLSDSNNKRWSTATIQRQLERFTEIRRSKSSEYDVTIYRRKTFVNPKVLQKKFATRMHSTTRTPVFLAGVPVQLRKLAWWQSNDLRNSRHKSRMAFVTNPMIPRVTRRRRLYPIVGIGSDNCTTGDQINTRRKKMSLFIYIHGYNNNYYEACQMASQLAAVMQLPLDYKTVLFCWPGGDSLFQYRKASRGIFASCCVTETLETLLRELALQELYRDVHVLCHSMGARVFLTTFERMLQNDQWKKVFNNDSLSLANVMFVNPDYDLDYFVNEIWTSLNSEVGRLTIYGDTNDVALKFSQFFGKRASLGRCLYSMYKSPGIGIGEVRDVNWQTKSISRLDTMTCNDGSLFVKSNSDILELSTGLSGCFNVRNEKFGKIASPRILLPKSVSKGDPSINRVFFAEDETQENRAWLDLDVIDCSYIDTNTNAVRHTYFNLSRDIVEDMKVVMIDKIYAKQRVARLSHRIGNVYLLCVTPSYITDIWR